MLIRNTQPPQPRKARLAQHPASPAQQSDGRTQKVSSSKRNDALKTLLQELRTGRRNGGRSFRATLEIASEAIWSNRMRSFLTMLGIVIGIAAVIGALTLGQGVGAYFENVIASQGANTITIQAGASNNRSTMTTTIRQLSLRDYQSLQKLSNVASSSPLVSVGNGQVVYGNQNWNTRIQGVNTEYQVIENWDIAQGLWFSSAEDSGAEAVAVIGDTVKQNLFNASGTDPIGKQIRVRNQLFRVIGVLAVKGGLRQDDVIYVPYKAAQARLTDSFDLSEIILAADTQNDIDSIVQELTSTLEQNHHVPRGKPDDFQISTSTQTLQRSQQTTSAISLLLSGIAAISLTVGGIGIMNIMLVSVTERTREIGLRMAVGAKRRDIRNQFLVESLFICILGGILGLLVGLLIGWLMTSVLLSALLGSSGNVPFIVTPTILILPFVVSLSIGIVFGLYPAIRASRLDPIVALQRAR